MKRKVLFIKQDGSDDTIRNAVQADGWEVWYAQSVAHALALIEQVGFWVGLALIGTPHDPVYLDKLEKVLGYRTDIHWIVIIPPNCRPDVSMDTSEARLIREHAYDFHTLPVENDRLLHALGHAYGLSKVNSQAKAGIPANALPGGLGLIGRSLVMQKLFRQIDKISGQESAVMITGESGSGKDLVAETIHHKSIRASRPFIRVACETLSGAAGQTMLFGAEKNEKNRQKVMPGLVELAQGGILFLNGVGQLSWERQFDILSLIKDRTFRRVGGTEDIPVDVRLVVANESDLSREVREGEFRADLFFNLRVVRLEIPPLRDRDDDIMLLAEYFLKNSEIKNPRIRGFGEKACKVMRQYDWPGNVRELKSCIDQAGLLSENQWLTPEDLGLERRNRKRYLTTLEDHRAEADQDAIISAMRYANYNITKAAKILNVSRVTLYSLIDKYHLHFMSSQGKSS
ncbi:MAG: sigma-54-dependent transcriptional regulator [Methylomicrobium sp.]